MEGDTEWLSKMLCQSLGWEPTLAEEVVDALAAAQNPQEIEVIVQEYLGGSKEVRKIVDIFKGTTPNQAASGASNGRTPRSGGGRQGGSVTIRHVAGRSKVAPSSAVPRRVAVEKDVCNCLGCGKIYHTRSDTVDTNIFLDSGGTCTSCGFKVALSSTEASQFRPLSSQRQSGDASTSGQATMEERIAEAKALKDRLVDYDRNSRQRTTVVDDQNDYFEIDANQWLDPEEREHLKKQQREIEEAEEARKRSVTVTLDLLGRKVVMAEDQAPTAAALKAAEASLAAARATGAEIPQGGGTAVNLALKTAHRIQPSSALPVQRPMFVHVAPETKEERQKRKGIAVDRPELQQEDTQDVVGGWGDERKGHQQGSGLSVKDAKKRQSQGLSVVGRRDKNVPGGSMTGFETSTQQAIAGGEKAMTKRRKPKLKRIQNSDIFEGIDEAALDDIRPED